MAGKPAGMARTRGYMLHPCIKVEGVRAVEQESSRAGDAFDGRRKIFRVFRIGGFAKSATFCHLLSPRNARAMEQENR